MRTRCTCCNQLADHLTRIGDVDLVCEDCLEMNFTLCDRCGEYYSDAVCFYEYGDELLCEYCFSDTEDD